MSENQDFSFPAIIQLNVGGQVFTTSLSTLRKYKSMLSSMFSVGLKPHFIFTKINL